MGQGSSQNFWSPGDEGVRVSVISTSDHKVVGTPIDLTNKSPSDIRLHFGKVSKMSYTSGHGIGISGSRYQYIRPAQRLPIIISSQSLGPSSIAEIKRYFTDEQTIRGIAGYMGIDFDILISGEYRIMIEPIAYVTLQGVRILTYFWICLSGQELNLRPTILIQQSMLPIRCTISGRNFEV